MLFQQAADTLIPHLDEAHLCLYNPNLIDGKASAITVGSGSGGSGSRIVYAAMLQVGSAAYSSIQQVNSNGCRIFLLHSD